MKVSMKVDYGLRAMVALAQRYGRGAVHSSEIAAQQQVPESYLEQLLTILAKAGFIKSKRGPQGGHALTRPPTQITLDEVVAALEGLTPPISCIQNPADCAQAATCAQRDVWRATEEAAQKVLKSTTLAQLAQNQQRRQREGMYYI